MSAKNKKDKSKRFICLCNSVPQSEIEDAIRRGCTNLGKIFDSTSAGVGACGGSCQPILKRMLEVYLNTRAFPEDPRSGLRRRRR